MRDHKIYREALEYEFNRVMVNDVVAKHGFDTAKNYGMDEISCLKQAIVALSVAKECIRDELHDLRATLPLKGK